MTDIFKWSSPAFGSGKEGAIRHYGARVFLRLFDNGVEGEALTFPDGQKERAELLNALGKAFGLKPELALASERIVELEQKLHYAELEVERYKSRLRSQASTLATHHNYSELDIEVARAQGYVDGLEYKVGDMARNPTPAPESISLAEFNRRLRS